VGTPKQIGWAAQLLGRWTCPGPRTGLKLVNAAGFAYMAEARLEIHLKSGQARSMCLSQECRRQFRVGG
jgi:hypothetical protein